MVFPGMPVAAERTDYLVKHLFVFPVIHLLKNNKCMSKVSKSLQ